MKKILSIVMTLVTICTVNAQESSYPPGIVIKHTAPDTQKYIGSPSICILPNGDYIVSHDEFGPKSREFESANTYIYRSSDKGNTWKNISQINGQFWSNLFVVRGDLYIMGTNKHHGNLIIRKSSDGGMTWTVPYNGQNGLLLEGEYHTAPVPVVFHNGRVWRGIEYATAKTTEWGKRYSAMIVSAAINSDFLDSKSWTRSNHLGYNPAYLGGHFSAWLEGNIVISPDNEVFDVLRVNQDQPGEEKIAIVKVSEDSKVSFNPEDFYTMPGASKKFTIRYDDVTKRYWAIVNDVPVDCQDKNPHAVRNHLSLISSANLKEWNSNKVLLSHPDSEKHGFQYIDWVIDGNDIIYLSRTAYNDNSGGANNYHDANYLTFHRITNFRKYIISP